MVNYPMPTGNPTYFEGDIRKENPKAFGFFYVKVTAPDNLKVPILLTKNNINITMAPTGTWKGVYFSEELYNAEKYGYKFEVLKGYLFAKKYDIFKDFILKLYEIKKNSHKNEAKYTISKFIMNAFGGRLGMSPFAEKHKIISSDSHNSYITKDISNVIDLNNGKELISYLETELESDFLRNFNISIPIAMAITASARIHMSKFKNLPGVQTNYIIHIQIQLFTINLYQMTW